MYIKRMVEEIKWIKMNEREQHSAAIALQL